MYCRGRCKVVGPNIERYFARVLLGASVTLREKDGLELPATKATDVVELLNRVLIIPDA